MIRPFAFRPASIALALAASALAAEPAARGPVTRVEDILGVPTFTLDGEPFLVPTFETYAPGDRTFAQFAGTGTRVFMFNTNAAACDYGHSAPTWPEPETFDYRQLDERARMVLRARPDALLLPRVYVGTPAWWLERNPGELEVLDDGSTVYAEPNRNPTIPKGRPFPSLASVRWRADMSRGLRSLIAHIRSSEYGDRVFGIFLSGLDTEEWYPWGSGSDQLAGYSGPTARAFGEWLRRRYGTAEALRRAWGRTVRDFRDARVPSRQERYDLGRRTFRDPRAKRDVIDFYLFYNEIIPETIGVFARVVKEATGGRVVVGAFYGYQYEFAGDPEFGHNSLGAFARCPDLDFIAVTSSYYARAFATGGDYVRSPARSIALHGKLWYHDNDTVSFLAREVLGRSGKPQEWIDHHLRVLGATETPQESRWMFRRAAGFALCHGFYQSFFDLHGGYFDHPDLLDEVARLNALFARAARDDRRSASEILVVADEASCAFATFRSALLRVSLLGPPSQLIRIGAPADHVLLDDLALLDASPYKLVVFLNAYGLDEARRALIRKKILGAGRHIVWCYAPGYFDGMRADPDLMRDATGIRIVPSSDETPVAPRIRVAPRGASSLGFDGIVGPEERCGRLFFVDDPEAEILGTHPESGRATLARKDMGGWTSYYAITPALPAALYRAIARAAGVHIYDDRDDVLYANRSYVVVHANGAGRRVIRFPRRGPVEGAIDGRLLAEDAESCELEFENGETRILRLPRGADPDKRGRP